MLRINVRETWCADVMLLLESTGEKEARISLVESAGSTPKQTSTFSYQKNFLLFFVRNSYSSLKCVEYYKQFFYVKKF